MIGQLFYNSGLFFFFSASFVIFKAYQNLKKMFPLTKMHTISLPPSHESPAEDTSTTCIEKYRQRLVSTHVKTDYDLN